MRLCFLIFWTAAMVRATCLPVDRDIIRTSDLARLLPAFADADPNGFVAFAPVPPAPRVLKPLEIYALAKRLNIALTAAPGDVCFERLAAPLTEERIRAALLAAIGVPVAELTIVEFSHVLVPEGAVEFAKPTPPNPAALGRPLLFRGRIVASEGRTVPIWAKVTAVVKAPSVRARVSLKKGRVITVEQIEVSDTQPYPVFAAAPSSVEDVAGQRAQSDIPAAARILPTMLESRDVLSGDVVEVEASDGLAHIRFTARAQSSAKTGDTVLLKNPTNGRVFRGMVTARDKVEVRTAGSL